MTVSTLTKLTRRLMAAHHSTNYKARPMKIYLQPGITITHKVTPMAFDERLAWASDRFGGPEEFVISFVDGIAEVPARLGDWMTKHGLCLDRQPTATSLFDRLRGSRTSLS